MDEHAERPQSDRALDEHETERGEHNRLGYRSVDEEASYDEAASQGTGRGEPPAEEESPGD